MFVVPAFEWPALEGPAFERPAFERPAFERPTVMGSVLVGLAFEGITFEGLAFVEPAFEGNGSNALTLDGPALEGSSLEGPAFKGINWEGPGFNLHPELEGPESAGSILDVSLLLEITFIGMLVADINGTIFDLFLCLLCAFSNLLISVAYEFVSELIEIY